jgi:hypothetical protein
LPEGSPAHRNQRGSGPRAALALLGELSANARALKRQAARQGPRVAAALAFVAIGACDQGAQHDTPRVGPYLTLLSTNVSPNALFDVRKNIELAFDQQLLPLSVNRQSIGLRDASGNGVTSLVITYDPVARVVVLEPPAGGDWLQPGLAYEVVLGVPHGDDDSGGLRSITRATLDPNSTRIIGFQTCGGVSACPSDPLPPAPTTVRFCNDVLPIFLRHCSSPGLCHGTDAVNPYPAAGLLLNDSINFAKTAVGRVAQSSNTGPSAGRAEPPGHEFGISMPIVDPGAPANSWLIYKLLLSQPHDDGVDAGAETRARCYPDAGEIPNPPVDPFGGRQPFSVQFARMTDADRALLSDYVSGNPMPYPVGGGNQIDFADLERIRLWIAQGAVIEDCGGCEK